MLRTMLHGKLHRVRVTHTELDYEGSVAIDPVLMEAADIREFQQVDVYDIANGERFTSYAVRGERDSGAIAVLGAAARKVARGDLLIICVYARLDEAEIVRHAPRIVFVDENNRMTHGHNLSAPEQIAV